MSTAYGYKFQKIGYKVQNVCNDEETAWYDQELHL